MRRSRFTSIEAGFDAEVEVGLRAMGLPCIVMIEVYDYSYRWPQGSPCESRANE